MNLALFFAVGVGGLVGAPSRYLLDNAISNRFVTVFPWGTFVINISGSLLLGLLTGLSLGHHLPAIPKALLATGFCGAYTTFSTFTYESVQLIEDGKLAQASINVLASVAVGLGAAALGLAIGLAI